MGMCETANDKFLIGTASVYNKTYYYNPYFKDLPAQVKTELQEMCTAYAGKLHCAFSIKFKDSGDIYFETAARDDDFLFSEEETDVALKELAEEKQDFFLSLKIWYRMFILKTDSWD